MNSNIFIINNVKGKFCYICNSINLDWENNIENYDKNETLDLNKFINKYNVYICNAALYFKKSNIILYIDSINILNYLEIKLKNTYIICDLEKNFNKNQISEDIIEIRLNSYNISIKNNEIDNNIFHPYTNYNYYYSSSYKDNNSLDNIYDNSCDTKKDNICNYSLDNIYDHSCDTKKDNICNHSCNNKIYNICNNLRCQTCDSQYCKK